MHRELHGAIAVDLEIMVIIKGEIIHGDNHANEVTECASGKVLMLVNVFYALPPTKPFPLAHSVTSFA